MKISLTKETEVKLEVTKIKKAKKRKVRGKKQSRLYSNSLSLGGLSEQGKHNKLKRGRKTLIKKIEDGLQGNSKVEVSGTVPGGQRLKTPNSLFSFKESEQNFKAIFERAPSSKIFFGDCSSRETDQKMDWEASVSSSEIGSVNRAAEVSKNTTLDDSVVILESKIRRGKSTSGKTRNKSEQVSVIREVVVISDAEEGSPSHQEKIQSNEKIEILGKKGNGKVARQQTSNDVILISPCEHTVQVPNSNCNENRKPRRLRSVRLYPETDAKRPKTVTISLEDGLSMRTSPDLKVIAVTAQDFIPLSLHSHSQLHSRKKRNELVSSTTSQDAEDVQLDSETLPCTSTSSTQLVQNKENSRWTPTGVPSDLGNAKRILRPIVIDGSNVAYSHGRKKKLFSCKGIELCVKFFQKRGHEVTAFVPQFRRGRSREVVDQKILEKLGDSQIVVFTPSRIIDGVLINSYDDRFILDFAARTGGVIVSNDNYRDIKNEKPEWKDVVNYRLLMYLFVGDIFMIPDDPLGKQGDSLETFLSFPC